jgi:hypothetical protein
MTINLSQKSQYSFAGGLVVSPTYNQFDEDGSFFGTRMVCLADTVNITDIEVTTELFVRYGMCWFKGANDGDIVELSLVDKDDVLGLFTALGYTVGVDVLELGKLAENIPMYPGDTPWTTFDTGDTAPVIEGLYIRIKYDNNHATLDTTMGMVFNWFKSGA